MTISIHLLFDEKRRGSLKSILIRSKTLIVFVSVSSCTLWDLSFSSAHIWYDEHTQRISSVEKGKFLFVRCVRVLLPLALWVV